MKYIQYSLKIFGLVSSYIVQYVFKLWGVISLLLLGYDTVAKIEGKLKDAQHTNYPIMPAVISNDKKTSHYIVYLCIENWIDHRMCFLVCDTTMLGKVRTLLN